MTSLTYDTIIVGGGAAGLTAATILARAHRNVLIVDAGKQSNKVSHEAHGVFTRDRALPSQLYEIATKQLLTYPTARLQHDTVVSVSRDNEFILTLQDNNSHVRAKSILLAQGMNYKLPPIKGLQQLWGSRAWHCPYCDGYESKGKRLLGIMEGDWRDHMSQILPIWNKPFAIVTPSEVEKVTEEDGEVKAYLSDGSILAADQIATQIYLEPRDSLTKMAGVQLTATGHVVVDEKNQTSIQGVYAAGDQITPRGQVNFAVASGHAAAISINTYLAS